MPTAKWLWDWLKDRPSSRRPDDPLSRYASLSIQRLEERRVLSISVTVDPMSPGDITVDIGDDGGTATLTVDGNNLIIDDPDSSDPGDTYTFDLNDITSLTIQGDTGTQTVEFVGDNPFLLPSLDINNTVEVAVIAQPITVTTGHLDIHVAEFIHGGTTVDPAAALTTNTGSIFLTVDAGGMTLGSVSSAGSVSLIGGDVTLDGTVTATNGSVSIQGEMLDVNAAVTAATSLTLDGTSITIDGALTAQSGNLSITAADAIDIGADGDITLQDGQLTIAAGTGADSHLTMADGASVNVMTNSGGLDHSLSAGGNIQLGELLLNGSGNGLSVTAGGAILDGNGAAVNILAGTVTLDGASIGTSTDRLDTEVTSLSLLSTGDAYLSQGGDLNLAFAVTSGLAAVDVSGHLTVASSSADTIDLESTDGLDVDGSLTATSHISLTTTGAASDLTIKDGAAVTSSGGDIVISADGMVTIDESVGTTGAGTLTVTGNSGAGARQILIQNGAVVSTENGTLSLDADQGTQQNGDFAGVEITGAGTVVEVTGSGGLIIDGRGGDTGSHQYGVLVQDGALVRGGTTSAVQITGVGGASSDSDNAGVVVTGTGASITSMGADLQITGTGGGSGSSSGNVGVLVAGASISAGGSGTTTVQGTGGGTAGTDNIGVQVDGSLGAAGISSAGAVTVTGIEGGGADSLGILLANGGTIANTANGQVTITTNSLSIDAASTVAAGTGTVTLQQRTAGVGIDLGSEADTSGGPLALSDAELNQITAGTLVIGNAAAGSITLRDAISPAGVSTLQLVTGGAIIDDSANGADITVANLALIAANGIGATDALETAVANLAFRNTTSGAVHIQNAGSLTITAVGVLDGTAGNQVGNFSGANTAVSAASPLTFAIDTTSVGSATYTAGESSDSPTFADDLTINAGVTVSVTGAGADLTLNAGDDILINGGTAASGSGALTLQAGFNDTDGSGAITIGGTLAAATYASLSSVSGITDTAGAALNLSSLELLGTGDVVLDNGHDIDALAAQLEGSLTYSDTDGFTVATVNTSTGITLSSSGETLDLTTTAGTIVIAADVTSDGDQNYHSDVEIDGNITLAAGSGDVTFDGLVDASLTALTSDLTITAEDVAFQANVGGGTPLSALSITAAGNISTTADVVVDGNVDLTASGVTGLDLGGSLTSQTGTLTLIADGTGDVSVAGSLAAAGDLSVQANGIAGGSIDIGGNVDSSAGAVELVADASLEVQGTIAAATSINAATSIGVMTFHDTLTTTTGSITLTNADTLTLSGAVSSGNAFTQNGSGDVALGANVTASNAILFQSDLVLLADITLTSSAGGVTLQGTIDADSTNGLLEEGLTIAAGTGDISLGDAIGVGTALEFLDASTSGDLSAQSTITTSGLITLSGDSLTLNDALDAGTSLTLTSTSDLHAAADLTAGTFLDVNAGTDATLGGDLLADAAITVTASNGGIDITGDVTSTNASVLLEALAGNAAIHVGGDILAATDATLSNATAGIDLDGTLTATGGSVDLDASTSIDVAGDVTAGTNADLDAGTNVTLGGGLLADTAITVTASNGGISVVGDVTSTSDSILLEALAGNAVIQVGGDVLAATDATMNNLTAGIELDGKLTATGGAINLDAGTSIEIAGDVTVGTTADLDAGTNVELGGDLLADAAITVTASNGGLDITGDVTSTNASVLLEALAGNAAIHVGGNVLAGTDATIRNVTAAIDLDGTLTATAGLIDLDAGTAIDIIGSVTAGTTVDIDAGTSISLGADLVADDAITLTASNGGLDITGGVTSTNASVLLEALAGNASIQVGGNVLADTSVTISHATAGIDLHGTLTATGGAIDLDASTSIDIVGDVTAGTTADLDAGTSVILGGGLLADATISVTAANGGIGITGTVTSTNASVLLEVLAGSSLLQVGGNVLADTDVTIHNVTAGIDLNGTLTATSGAVDLDAGTTIDVAGAVTAGTSADLDAGTSIVLGGDLLADSAITVTAGNGGIGITGEVTSTNASILLESLAGNAVIHVGGNVLAETDVTINNATAGIDLDGTLTATTGRVDLDAASAIEVTGAVTAGTTADLDAGTSINLGAGLEADDAITLTASNGGIEITGSVTSTNASVLLEVLAGTSAIHVGGDILAGTSVTVDHATADIEVDGSVTAGTTADLDAGTSITVGGDLLADMAVTVTARNGGVDITGNVTSTNASILLEALAGNAVIHIGGNALADTDVTISNATAGIDLDGTLTATTGAIDLDAAGAITIAGNVSGNANVTMNTTIGIIDLDGSVESLGADVVIEATGPVTIDGNVTALDDVEIRSLLQAAAVSLNGTVTATNGDLFVLGQTITAQQALSAGGGVHLDALAGTTLATTAATVSAVTGITIDGSLTTAANLLVDNGFLTINGHVTLTQNVLFDTDVDNAGNEAAADITITGTVSLSTFTLTLDAGTGGDIDLQGAVSGTGDLVVEQGNALQFAAISVNDLTINDATTSIVFHGPVTATTAGMDAGDISVSSSGTLALEGALSADGTVMLSAAGGMLLCADLTGSSFIFTDAIELCDDVTISATGLVEFQGTIDSEANQAYSLTINTAGLTSFQGAIGSGTNQQLGGLTTDAAGTTQIAANVTTTGDQRYLDAVTLTGNVTLTGVDGNATGEAIEFGSTLAGGGFSLTVAGGGAFTGAVSGVNAFVADRIDTESTLSAVAVNVTGTAEIGGDITTTQTQAYGGSVLLTGDAVLTSTGSGAAGNITFDSTIDGAHALQVDTAGTTTFRGLVGDGTELTSLTTSGGGSTVISTAAITAGVIDLQDNVSLTLSATLAGTTSVSFGGTVSGQAGTEDLTVNSGGDADFAGSISSLDQVAVNAAGTTTFSGNINVSGALTTTGGGVTKIDTASITAGSVNFSDAVELCQDLLVTAGSINFGSTLNEAAMATGSDLTLTITNPNLATGDIRFTGSVGGTTALDSLTITTANDVTFSSTVRLVGDLEQAAGTGTTAFHGTSGTGIGGQLLVTTNEVTFSTSDVITVGAIVIAAQNGIALNANAGLNAGASTITLRANQDNTGNQGFTQASSAVIQTTSNSLSAVVIDVDGTGSAAISDIRAGTTTGVVSITAGGQISDNLSGEGANITAHAAALRGAAGIGIGAGADVDINTDVDELAFSSTGAGVNISNSGTLTLTAVDGLTTSLAFGGGTLFASGSLTVAMNTQVGGTFNFIAGDDSAAINDLTISADITHLTGQGEISFQAGDDIVQTAGTVQCIGAPVGALSRINFTADHEGSGADGDRGGITQTGGNVLASELQIRSYDAVLMNQATNDAKILAAVVTGTGASFTFRDANDLTVYRIPGMGGVVGLTTNGGDVNLTTGGQLILGGTGEDILAAGATVTITAGNGFNEGADSTITAANLLLLGTGTFNVAQQNQVSVLAADINGTLVYTDANALSVGTVGATSGITTSNDDVRLNTGGNLIIDGDVTLGTGDLTLNVAGAVTQTTGNDLTAAGLQLLGTGTVTLNNVGNNVTTLAANYNGTIAYTDANALVIGTVSDSATGATSNGIGTSNDDVKLTVLAGGLTLGDAVGTAGQDDIALGSGNLTLNVVGAVTQTADNNITAAGLQLLGSGSITLTNTGNNVTTLAASYDGTIAYTDANGLTIGTVTDGPSAMTTNGITTSNDDVRLNVLAGGLAIGDGGTNDDIALGTGDLTLNVSGAVTQTSGNDITAAGLQLLGSGTVTLTNATNNVTTLAANYDGTIAYTDANGLNIGTVTDGPSATTTNGITTSNDDVRLNVLAGGLTIGDGGTTEDIALGSGALTLNVTGAVTQTAGNDITAAGLQLLGNGSVTLTNTGNNVSTLAANYDGTIAYTDANGLTIGTVTDGPSSTTTNGITTSNDDVRLNVLAGGLTIGDGGTNDDIALGSGDLTLNITGAVTQTTGNDITAAGLQLLGSGTVTLTNTTNNITKLAANYDGTIAYTDANALTIGTVTDGPSATTTNGITTSNDDVRLNVLAGGLTIGDGGTNDDIALGTGTLTLNVTGAVTQTASNDITAAGLQLLGSGTVTLTNNGNNVSTLAANYNGTIAYTDANTLTIGTVTDGPSATTTNGITTSNDDVRLNVLAGGLTIGDGGTNDDIALGTGDLTLNVTGAVTQTSGNDITAAGLQLRGSGTVTLTNTGNNVSTLAANYDGTMAYTDANGLVIGTVTDNAAAPNLTTNGITTSNDDVRLTVLTGGLTIGDAVGTNGLDDIALGSGNLTLNVVGAITQTANNTITVGGLQLLGTGSVVLMEAGNDVGTLAANYNGTIAITDANGLIIGTVTDGPSGTTTSGVTTSNDDVRLTVLAGGLTIGDAVGVAGQDDIALGTGDLTLDVTGALTQTANNNITANGLRLLGSGSIALTNTGNNVNVLAGSYDGEIAYTDADALIVNTVTDNALPTAASTYGVTTNDHDLTLVTGGLLTLTSPVSDVAINVGTATLIIDSAGGLVMPQARLVAEELLLLGTGDFTVSSEVRTVAADITGNLHLHSNLELFVDTVNGVSGISTAGGDVTVTTVSYLNINENINTGPGAGGVIEVYGGNIAAQLIVGSGNITLHGGIGSSGMEFDDIDIRVAQNSTTSMLFSTTSMIYVRADVTATTVTMQAYQGIIVEAAITSTVGDISLLAGVAGPVRGRVYIAAAGYVNSAADVTLSGVEGLWPLGPGGVYIESDGANEQILAVGDVNFTAGSEVYAQGIVRSTSGDIVFTSVTLNLQTTLQADVGSVDFGEQVILTGDATVIAGADVDFRNVVRDDGQAGTSSHLLVTAAGTTTFHNTVGAGSSGAITSLTVNGGGLTQICNTITTVGGQTYADAVVLCNDVILTSTAAGAIVFESTIDSDAVTPRALTVTTSGLTDFQGAVGQTRALRTLTTNGGGSTQFGGGLVRTTGAQSYQDNVVLTADVTWQTVASSNNGANITVGGTIDGNTFDLTIDAGTQGDITLFQAVSDVGQFTVNRGDVQQYAALQVAGLQIQAATTSVTFGGAVVVTDSASVTSGGTITQASTFSAGQDVEFDAVGALQVQGTLTAGQSVTLLSDQSIALTAAVTATAGSLVANAGTTLSATQALMAGDAVELTAVTGITLGNNADVMAGAGGITVTGTLTTAADFSTDNGAIVVTGPVTLTGAVVWDSDKNETGGADITLQQAVATGDFALTVDAGSLGDLSFQSTITGGGDVTIEDGAILLFSGAISVDNFTIQDATTSVTLNGPVNVTGDVQIQSGGSVTALSTIDAGSDVSLTAAGAIELQDAVEAQSNVSLASTAASVTLLSTVEAVTGDLSVSAGTTLSASQALTAGDALSLTAGTTLTLAEPADIVAGVGGVSLTASQINTAAEITTNNGNVTVTGAVQLTGDVTIDTGASGSVLVTGSINGSTAFQQSLTLSTGTGDITVTGDIGTTTALQNVVITDADDVNLGGGITAEHLLQQSGQGTTTIVGAVNTYGTSGIRLTTEAIVFAAGTASMDSHGNPIVLTADAITLPTKFTNATGSTVTLQTLSAGTSIGLEDSTSDLNFTDAQLDTIHSQNLIIGSATQTAGIRVGTDGPLTQDENLTLLTAGNITVDGSLSATSANTFLFDAGGNISVNGTVATLSGTLQLLADQNISMGSSGLVQSASGNVTVLADADGDANGAGGGITMANGAVINSGTGTLLLQADQNIVIGQLITANATSLALQVTSLTGGIVDGGDAGVDILLSNANGVATLTAVTGVGSATGSGADAALETQVAQLQVVNSTSGNIAIDEVDAITILGIDQQGPGAVLLTAGGTLQVAAGGIGVQTQGGDISITTTGAASDLVLMSALNSRGGDITLTVGDDLTQSSTAPVTTQQGQLTLVVAGDASLGGIVQTGGGDLTGTIGGNFLQGTLAPISTGGGDISLTVTGTSTLSAAITTAGGSLLLDNVGSTSILASAPISTSGGEVTLLVDGQLSLASQITTTGGDVSLTVGGDTNFAPTASILTANGDFAAEVTGAVTMANGSVINTALGTLELQAGGNITVGQLITTNATAQAMLIQSTGGAVIDGGDGGGADVIANAAGAVVTIIAATGVGSAAGGGSDAALETQISSLVLQNTTSGQVAIDELDSLQIRELTQSGSGNVTVNTVGTLTLVTGQPGLSATTGLVTLQATAAASDIVINSLVRTTSGDINISAANDVQMGAGSQVLTLSGDITVVADADGTQNGNGGAVFMANGAALHGGSGTVTVRADENITVGRIDTSNTVSLTSHSGGIVDGGDLGGADIVASTLVIQSVAGIGSANALETSVGLLAAANLGSGAIRIANESIGALTIGQVGSVSGVTNTGSTAQVIDIVNVGGMNVNAAVRNATGGSIQLMTVENGGDNDHLIVNAAITATGGSGDITLTAAHNLVINDSGNGTGDDISVVNGGEILGTAGGDVIIGPNVVVRSASGAVTNIEPVLINVLTPQISALGVGTLTMTVQRPLEIGTVIIIDWGDGTVETFVVTDANQQTLTFQHQYIGPPNPANPAADIPISITVQNPGVTTGTGPSDTPNTVKVTNADYVPNIRFAANGEVLTSTDVGELNYTVFTGVFKTPGDGLASFAFDLTPEVKLLDFPQQTVPDASLLTVTAPLAQTTTDNEGIRTVDTLGDSERVVILEVLGPDGSVQATVILAEDVLDDIAGVVENLPDGRYRFLLREPGEPVPRLLQMVDVHDGKIADDLNSTLDRPRSLRVPAAQGDALPPVDETPVPSADALQPENEPSVPAQPESGMMSWRSRRAWQMALNSALAGEAEAEGREIEGTGSPEIAEPAQPASSTEPAEAVWSGTTSEPQVGFSRAARLFRKFSVT